MGQFTAVAVAVAVVRARNYMQLISNIASCCCCGCRTLTFVAVFYLPLAVFKLIATWLEAFLGN